MPGMTHCEWQQKLEHPANDITTCQACLWQVQNAVSVCILYVLMNNSGYSSKKVKTYP